METNILPCVASIQKCSNPDPQLSERDEDYLWGDLQDCCESEEQYEPQSADSEGALYSICIGDIIRHPEGCYEIVHRLGKGAYSVVWLARDLRLNTCVALKVMVAGSVGEREFLNQQMLKEAPNLDTSHINLYKDTFLLTSPYNVSGKPPTIFHRALVLPLEGPSLREGWINGFDRSLKSRIAAANSFLGALRELHQAGFVHSDIALGNVLWKIDPAFVQDINANPVKALGAPTERMRLTDGEGLQSGHRVMPVKIPRENLSRKVCLADFGIMLSANKTKFRYKLQGTPEFLTLERFHDRDPSAASDMWSFMVIFVYLYLGTQAFPNTSLNWMPGGDLRSIWENLGPFPAEWKTATTPEYGVSYATHPDDLGPDPPKSKFPSKLREDWTKHVTSRLETYSRMAKNGGDDEVARTAKRLKEELRVKKEGEAHALKVIHSVFRYKPGCRLTAEQLLTDPEWIKLMDLCGV